MSKRSRRQMKKARKRQLRKLARASAGGGGAAVVGWKIFKTVGIAGKVLGRKIAFNAGPVGAAYFCYQTGKWVYERFD